MMPELESFLSKTKEEPKVEVYRGWKGLKTIYDNALKESKKGDIHYVFGASKGEDEEATRRFYQNYTLKRHKLKIYQKIIFNEVARGNTPAYEGSKYSECRYLEQTTPAEIYIYNNKIFLVILTKIPVAILITSKSVAESFKQYFDIMWKIAKK